MIENTKKYAFDWALIGDIEMGRPTLGQMVSVEAVRLMLLSLKGVLEAYKDTQFAEDIFRQSGRQSGLAFYHRHFDESLEPEQFISKLQRILQSMGIGLINIEYAVDNGAQIVITLDEDLECSGLPITNSEMCHYTSGVISGLLEGYYQQPYRIEELDCWCSGDRTCRFKATRL